MPTMEETSPVVSRPAWGPSTSWTAGCWPGNWLGSSMCQSCLDGPGMGLNDCGGGELGGARMRMARLLPDN